MWRVEIDDSRIYSYNAVKYAMVSRNINMNEIRITLESATKQVPPSICHHLFIENSVISHFVDNLHSLQQ